MTTKEAIYLLRNTAWLAPSLEPIDEAVDMACEALRKTEPQTYYERGYQQGKEDEHRWWSKLCANCDGAIDEPQPSKILEAYAKGYKDGADAVKPKESE